jgi:3-oxoacyl-[acyl-carrier-protein] synthase III
MASFSVSGVRIAGVAAAVPLHEISNWDYDRLSDQEKKLLIKTTGVEKKRVAPQGLATSDLCFEAAQKLVSELGWSAGDIQLLIFLSQSRDYFLPSTSIILQDRLRLPKSCIAFDIGLGCSGFVYGLSVAASMMSTAKIKKALLLVGDISSATCSMDDKSTWPLFGDAGAATALELCDGVGAMSFTLGSDGAGYEAIIIPDGGIRNLITNDSLEKKKVSEGIERSRLNLALNGVDVFNFSVTEVPASIKEFFAYTDTSGTDYDHFIMHQANLLMNETIRKKLGIDASRVPYSLARFGNTSSASIPLTMISELRQELRTKKLSLLLSGFGVGLSWGTAGIVTRNIACPALIEV